MTEEQARAKRRNELRVGDRVRLRSGGPCMTVETSVGRYDIRCVWFDNQTLLRGSFTCDMLDLDPDAFSGLWSIEVELCADAMALGTRTTHVLRLAQIETVGDLIAHSESELLRYKNMGRKSLIELNRELAKLGLHLKGGTAPNEAS